jgi:hypothetical protein
MEQVLLLLMLIPTVPPAPAAAYAGIMEGWN